jgi:hypothetical protein
MGDAVMQPRPWHDKALALRAEGVSLVRTADACDIDLTTLKRFLYPEYRERQKLAVAASRKKRLASDPEYRKQQAAAHTKRTRLARHRTAAKCEAYDTGRRYEDVCASWSITP